MPSFFLHSFLSSFPSFSPSLFPPLAFQKKNLSWIMMPWASLSASFNCKLLDCRDHVWVIFLSYVSAQSRWSINAWWINDCLEGVKGKLPSLALPSLFLWWKHKNPTSSHSYWLACIPLPSPSYKKHYILKWNKGNGNQKAMFWVRSKTYVKNEDSKWWICARLLATSPLCLAALVRSRRYRSLQPPDGDGLSGQGSRPGLATVMLSSQYLWEGSRQYGGEAHTIFFWPLKTWGRISVGSETKADFCFAHKNSHYHLLILLC